MNETEHLLTCLMEECAEVAKDCAKALRFGLDDRLTKDPDGPRGTEGPTNRDKIVAELNDLMGAAEALVECGVLPLHWQNGEAQFEKFVRIRSFMRYARRVGTLEPCNDSTNPTP